MTRQHFELIARTIRDERAKRPANGQYLDQLAASFADKFSTVNPRFSRARFLAACGVEEEG